MENWIEFEGKRFPVASGERVIDALRRQSAPVNFSCRKGACRSCMLQIESGEVVQNGKTLTPELREMGMFLPCCASSVDRVIAKRPDMSLFTLDAMVAGMTWSASDILRLELELTTDVPWQPGQQVGVYNDAGDQRSYSVVSTKQDYFLTLHVRIREGGRVSGWLAERQVGDSLRLQAPHGEFAYPEGVIDRPLFLVGTGVGGGAILGIARDALEAGHRGPIHIFHGGRTAADLYLADDLAALASEQVTVTQAASREAAQGQPALRITELAFDRHPDLSDAELFFCGNPDMVETCRIRAVAAGAELARIHVDAYEGQESYIPREKEKLASIAPDPELWSALGEGPGLMAILKEFYGQVYEDPQLAPFFHRTAISRAIEKQYSFLQDLFAGVRHYFGEKPFNAHHWMVISDELFDYRERMFFDVVRRHGIPEDAIRRWASMHEMFRREIVKSSARGILYGNSEVFLEGYSTVALDVSTICDGCHKEVAAGQIVTTHNRTGEVYCPDCEGKDSVQLKEESMS